MGFDEVMQALESAGTEQTRKTYRRHGAKDPMFGVSFAVLGQLAKRIRVDHVMARQLWATRNVDARNLATMVADPRQVSAAEVESWAKEMAGGAFSGLLARNVAVRTPFARAKALAWVKSRNVGVAELGWLIVASGATRPAPFSDDDLLALIPTIETRIHGESNVVKDAMHRALIAIGVRNAPCRTAAIAAAKRIGKVDIDHGDTSCRTPDAATYIARAEAYRRAQATKRAARGQA